MDGFVAVTDFGWYSALSSAPGPKDANFWRPSARAFRFAIGTPFLFKLKAPRNAIVGFGFFAGFTVLPDWLAWDTFGEANGVPTLGALRKRLSTIQEGARIDADPAGRVGCCLIAEARFFSEREWVAQPKDWKPRTQTGATYDLAVGEGARVWNACLRRTGALATLAERTEQYGPRFGAPVLHRPRLGQSIFRIRVLDAYGRACAVTGEHSLPVLDAAHIKPYGEGGEHELTNGLSLRSDVHRLFDKGYVAIDQDRRFVVGRRLKDDFENGRSYYRLAGTPLQVPADPAAQPSASALAWHHEHVFLG